MPGAEIILIKKRGHYLEERIIMGHVKTFLARWQHHRFSPSRTQRLGGRSAFVNSGRTDGRIRTGPGPFDAPKHRNDRWHASRGATCHVPPREPLRKQALGQNFPRGGRRDPKLAGYMRPGMTHVPCKWRPQGVKILSAGGNFVF